MPDDGNNGQQDGQHGTQGAASSEPLTMAQLLQVLEERDRRQANIINAAVTAQLKRLMPKPQPPKGSDADPSDDGDDGDDDPQDQPPPQRRTEDVEAKKLRGQMARLQKELEEMRRREREKEAQLAEERRDNALRKIIEKAGVVDVEAVFRVVKPDLKIDEDGSYYGEGKDGVVSAEDFVAATVKANPWMQPATQRSGGGSADRNGAAQAGAPSGGKMREFRYDPTMRPDEMIRIGHELGHARDKKP